MCVHVSRENTYMVSVCDCRLVQCFLAATTLRESRLYNCTFNDYLAISAMMLPENRRSENSDQLRNQLPPPLLFRATRSAPASQQSPVLVSSRFIDASMYRDTCHAICIAICIAIPAIFNILASFILMSHRHKLSVS